MRSIGAWVDSGVKPCFAVTSQTGRRVEVTGHHPFLTVSGWQPLHDLVIGDAIAVPRSLPVFGHESLPEGLARLLGYFTGDGALSGNTPQFINVDAEIVADFNATIARHFPTCHVNQDGPHYTVCGYFRKRPGTYSRQPNPVIRWLKGFGLWGKKAEFKRFPDAAWRWDKETLRAFIVGLMSCDGSIFGTQNGRPRIEFAVASEGLAKDMHHAFVRFIGSRNRLGHDAVQTRAFEAPEPIGRTIPIASGGRQVDRWSSIA